MCARECFEVEMKATAKLDLSYSPQLAAFNFQGSHNLKGSHFGGLHMDSNYRIAHSQHHAHMKNTYAFVE